MDEARHLSDGTAISYRLRACEACRHRKALLTTRSPSHWHPNVQADQMWPADTMLELPHPEHIMSDSRAFNAETTTRIQFWWVVSSLIADPEAMLTGSCREERLESIECQIARLDGALRQSIASGQSTNLQDIPQALSSQHSPRPSAREIVASPLDPQPEDTFYRGDSSFDVRSGEASKLLENAHSDVCTSQQFCFLYVQLS